MSADSVWDDKRNRVKTWTGPGKQHNQKIVSGPDSGKYGLHRGYDPGHCREFQAGENYERGSSSGDKNSQSS